MRFLLIPLLIIISSLSSRAAVIMGRVMNPDGTRIGYASVEIEGTTFGAISDSVGHFEIRNIEPGHYVVRISCLGYQTLRDSVLLSEMKPAHEHATLFPEVLPGKEVLVETERVQSGVSATSPVRTEIVAGRDLQEHSTTGSVISGLEHETGLKTRPCSMCGSSGIGMQGMEPSYTEVNVDGMPVLTGMGTIYGIESLVASDVSRVELVKGASSAENGSGAIAGAVNLVSERPTTNRSLKLMASTDNVYQHTETVSATGAALSVPMRASFLYSAEPNRVDENHDGVTDTPQYHRINLSYGFSAGNVPTQGLTIGTRFYWDHRFAGQLGWTDSDRGSAEIYGRDILTQRGEASAHYDFGYRDWKLGAQTALVLHNQDSWYGTVPFNAEQRLSVTELSADRTWSAKHRTLFQLSYNYQEYQDNLHLNNPTDQLLNVPGIVVQHTWTPSEVWTMQGGSRAEYYEGDGIVLIPRASLRWQPLGKTTFRFTGGLGYRPVNLFSLDRAVGVGFENITLSDNLRPERTQSTSLSLNQRCAVLSWTGDVDLTAFYTHFDRKVIIALNPTASGAEYVMSNNAFSRGIEVQTRWKHPDGWLAKMGVTRSQTRYLSDAGWENMNLQFIYTGDAIVTKIWQRLGLAAEISTNVFGPQFLPPGRGREKSPTYATWDAELRKTWKSVTATIGVRNLFDWTQSDSPYQYDPATGRLIPDMAFMYGPILGRTFRAGLSYTM